MKKLFIVSAVLLVVVLIFLGIYNFAFKKGSDKNAAQENGTAEDSFSNNQTKETNGKQKIYAVSEQAVLGPIINKAASKVTYYSAGDGTVWESSFDGSSKNKTDSKVVNGIKGVLWSPDGKKTLTEFDDSRGHRYFEFDHATSSGTELKNGTDLAIWNNDGSKIIYKYFDSKSKSRSLDVADPNGSNWKKLSDLSFAKISIAAIPQTSLIAFWNFPSAKEETKLQTVGLLGGEVKTIFSGKFGADYLWAADGKKAVMSSLSSSGNKNLTLGVINLAGEYQDLNVPTFASKSVWSKDGKTIYYALPGEIPESAILPDEYQQKKFITSDTFWKVDTETGIKERILEVSEIGASYDATQLLLSPTESNLFFINRADGKLYGMGL